MAKRRRSARLGQFTPPDRFIVFTVGGTKERQPCTKRTFTSYGDAAKATLKCSRSRRNVSNKPCLLLMGWPGTEKLVGRCVKGKCGPPKPGDKYLIDHCGGAKKSRRELIKERVKMRSHVPSTGASKASRSGMRPGAKLVVKNGSKALKGRSRR